MDHDTSRRFSSLRQTETTVAHVSAGRANPQSVQQGYFNVLSVSIKETGPAKLAPNPRTVNVVASGLGVDGLLTALVASGPVDTVVDLFRCLEGYPVELVFLTSRFVVQDYWYRSALTQTCLPKKNNYNKLTN